ncbi:MAG: chloride channel protein [Nocardioidaceae bacterium]
MTHHRSPAQSSAQVPAQDRRGAESPTAPPAGSAADQPAPAAPPDPIALLRTRGYVVVLVMAAILGVPIAALAYWFLQFTTHLQGWLFTDLPTGLGFDGEPSWWPVPVLMVGGLLVALTIRYLPGNGGESPADGLQAGGGAPAAAALPGILLAAVVTLGSGAVLGPEAPLIALGAGVAAWTVRLVRRDAPAQAVALIGAAGSFAAISTLFGSPLLGAFLLLEIAGVGGAMTSLTLVPGFLAAGIGSLIFVGLDSLTGLGATSLSIPGLPGVGSPTLAEFGWALVIGAAAAPLGIGIRWLGLTLRPLVERRILLATPVVGLVVALLAVGYAEATGKQSSEVLFSGQSALGPLLAHSADYSAGALVLLLLCKGIGYGVSMSGFRGGPVFPAMFLGATGGLALSHLAGLEPISGAAMGIGAMSVAMLGLPLVSVLLATVLLASDGLQTMPLVIVAVVVAYVVRAWCLPVLSNAGKSPAAAETHGETAAAGTA